jgi:SAM-dependent methyltransferase
MTRPRYLDEIRTAYDAVTDVYAARFADVSTVVPLDRGLIVAFAEMIRAAGGPVADLGCGPGHLTALLHDLGLDTVGVDLSPAMIAYARRTHPQLRFDEGSLANLNIVDGALGGALVWYSTIHVPPADLPAIAAELHRVLRPGGHLLVGFFAADDPSPQPPDFDHKVTTAYRWHPDALGAVLTATGLTETARLVRVPAEDERFTHARLLLHKPH